ncbi:MAG: cytochrome c biogenesis CcdA family protein [Pseudomonadota bacterium]
MIDIALALLAGVLTIAAPCVLPILPILLGSAIGQTSGARPALIALGFVLTFAGCAMLFGLFAESLALAQETLRTVAIGLLLMFGLLMLWKRPFALLAQRLSGMVNRADAVGRRAGSGKLGGLMLGITLGVVWTPCAGPVLGAILTLVATARDLGRAGVLMFSYALGAGIPMLAIAYGGQYVSTRVRRVARYSGALQQLFGVLVIGTALAMYYQYDLLITLWLTQFFPHPR